MWDYLWESFVGALVAIFLPTICLYHAICGNIFLNVAVADATGLEKISNHLLIPFQYIFAGKLATKGPDGEWILEQRFTYDEHLALKSITSALALPWSLVLGSAAKACSLYNEKTHAQYVALSEHLSSTKVHSNLALYKELGLEIGNMANAAWMRKEKYQRRPGDERHLQAAKDGLKEIATIFTEEKIPWWIDCGTLLGAYRYGGVIPWDNDIDIALLLPDFENAKRALHKLDPSKYIVQDWSGRDFPDTFLKVYVKETGDLIDIYFYEIDQERRECSYIFSLDQHSFFFEWWKEGERRFTKPIAFHLLFPLKRATFDGIDVFVPNEVVPFLQRYYGENLSPARIYDSETGRFEKDLDHPYWSNPYVH